MESFRVKDLAKRLGIGESTIWRWVSEGRFPEPIRLGRRITVWKREDIEEFLGQAAAANQPR